MTVLEQRDKPKVAVEKTPQGQYVTEAPEVTSPAMQHNLLGTWGEWLGNPAARYGHLVSSQSVPMHIKLEMLKDEILSLCIAFTGTTLVKAERVIECRNESKRRFFDAMFRRWEREFVLQANVGIALGSLGLIKKWRFEVPQPVAVDAAPVWTRAATPFIITGFDPLFPAGSEPEFDISGHHFQGMQTPDGKVDVFHSLWLTFRKELAFGAYKGAGRLDHCYKQWWLKNFGADLYVVAMQKQANRVVESRYPVGVDKKTGKSNQKIALEVGDSVRSGATIAVPSDTYITTGLDGEDRMSSIQKWGIEFKEGSGDIGKFYEMDDHHDRKMSLGFFLPPQAFMNVTGGQLGGPTSADVLTRMAEDLLMQDAAELDRHLNEYVFPAISRANFAPTSPRVQVRTLGLATDNRGALLEMIKGLIGQHPDAKYFDMRGAMEKLEFPLKSAEQVRLEGAQPTKTVTAIAAADIDPQGSPLSPWPDDKDVPISKKDTDRPARNWDRRAPDAAVGLLDAVIIVGDTETALEAAGEDLPRWGYNPVLKRYQNLATGSMVSYDQVVMWALAVREQTSNVVTQWGNQVSVGSLRVNEWQRLMREEVKDTFLRQYMAGRGGRNAMTARDYGIVGALLKTQYHHLDSFATDIAAGRLSEAQILNRAQMYIDSAQQALVRGRTEAFGMPRMPAYPGDFQTQCGTNCLCDWVNIEEVRDADGKLTGWNATWRLKQGANHCTDCPSNAALWAPLFVPAGMTPAKARTWRRREQRRMLAARGL